MIVPYLRGHGPTRFVDPATPRSGQQAALAVDTVELLDALGIPRAVLAGYDWGGAPPASSPRLASSPNCDGSHAGVKSTCARPRSWSRRVGGRDQVERGEAPPSPSQAEVLPGRGGWWTPSRTPDSEASEGVTMDRRQRVPQVERPTTGQPDQPDRRLQFLRGQLADHAQIADETVEIAAHTWAIHGSIAVDGEVIMAEFDTQDEAETTLRALSESDTLLAPAGVLHQVSRPLDT